MGFLEGNFSFGIRGEFVSFGGGIYFNVYGFILTRCVDTFVRIAPIDVVDGVPRVFYAHRYAKEIMTSSNVNSF